MDQESEAYQSGSQEVTDNVSVTEVTRKEDCVSSGDSGILPLEKSLKGEYDME